MENARELALREVGRALALDPESVAASDVLSHLVRREGEHRDVHKALFAREMRMRVTLAKPALAVIACMLFLSTSLFALGVKNWTAAAILYVPLVAIGILMLRQTSRPVLWHAWALFFLTHLGVGCATLAFGPMLFAPALGVLGAVGFAPGCRPRAWQQKHFPEARFMREAAFIGPPLTFGIVVLLEVLGILPRSMAFVDGNIVIMPCAFHFPPGMTMVALVLLHLGVLIAPTVLLLQIIDRMFDDHRSALDAAARMRELVPEGARRAIVDPP